MRVQTQGENNMSGECAGLNHGTFPCTGTTVCSEDNALSKACISFALL